MGVYNWVDWNIKSEHLPGIVCPLLFRVVYFLNKLIHCKTRGESSLKFLFRHSQKGLPRGHAMSLPRASPGRRPGQEDKPPDRTTKEIDRDIMRVETQPLAL